MGQNLYAVIMAGGKGEWFWPLSNSRTPKQLLSLVGDRPLLAMAVERLAGFIPEDRIFIVTNASLVDSIQRIMPNFPHGNIIGEPFGRDTAAACALGTALVKSKDPDGVVCVLTADHVIKDEDVFKVTLSESAKLAVDKNAIVTIGIKPTFPSTGYGYIEAGDRIDCETRHEFFQARRFVEKPDVKTAESYLRHGNYCWNSGMFVWAVPTFEKALKDHAPKLAAMTGRLSQVKDVDELHRKLSEEYEPLERISVDYAIMEKFDNILMANGVFSWDDVGAWPAIENHFECDSDDNVVVGDCEAVASEGNLVVSQGRLTALIGVKDLVVVQADGATLVCTKENAQDVKKLVQKLKESGTHEELL